MRRPAQHTQEGIDMTILTAARHRPTGGFWGYQGFPVRPRPDTFTRSPRAFVQTTAASASPPHSTVSGAAWKPLCLAVPSCLAILGVGGVSGVLGISFPPPRKINIDSPSRIEVRSEIQLHARGGKKKPLKPLNPSSVESPASGLEKTHPIYMPGAPPETPQTPKPLPCRSLGKGAA